MKKVSYKTLGNRGKKIIMLPGWGFTSDIWMNLANNLAKEHTVFLVDLPGMGVNKNIICDSIDEFLEILDNSFSDNYVILGWSLGGMLGLLFAGKYKNKVSAIIMINATLKWVATNVWPGMPPNQWQAITESFTNTPFKFLNWFARNQLADKDIEIEKNIKEHLYNNFTLDNGVQMQHYLGLLGTLDLRSIQCDSKLTCIYARKDKIIPCFAEQEDINKIAKHNNTIIFEHEGHAPFLTNNNLLTDTVLRTII